VEVVIAAVFMAIALLGLLELNSSSNRTFMDAYYEFLACQLAKEPIEVFRAFGYRWLLTYQNHELPDYPLNEWKSFAGDKLDPSTHPPEVAYFERRIELIQENQQFPPAIKVVVTIRPSNESRIRTWLRRDPIKMEALIIEQPHEIAN